MKKIKLITGLSVLSAFGICTLPLTACNKQPIEQFTVHFETNGGSAIADIVVNKDEKITKPANPTKAGHTFINWCTDPALKTEYDFDSKVTSNLVLYAKWKVTGERSVTEQEWIDAFNLITDYTTWNYTYDLENKIVASGEVKSTTEQTWYMVPTQMVRHTLKTDAKSYYKKYDNCYYRIVTSSGIWHSRPVGVDLLSYRGSTLSPAIWDVIKYEYDEDLFDKELNAYRFEYEIAPGAKYSYIINFNDDKKISNLIEIAYSSEQDYTYSAIAFRDYSTTKATLPFKDDEVLWEKGTLNYSDNEYTNTTSTSYDELHNVSFTVDHQFQPTTIELLQSNRQKIEIPQEFGDCEIYVNGTKSSCTMTIDTTEAKLHISGLTLQANDKVQIVWNSIRFASTLGLIRPKYISVK